MKLRTKIDVTYNDGVTGSATGIVEGHLQNTSLMDNFNVIGANYKYSLPPNEQGEVQDITPILGFIVEGTDADNLYNIIKGDIPAGLEFREMQRYTYYLAFVYEMAKTFNITVEQIELIND
jgi:hypothetical protein